MTADVFRLADECKASVSAVCRALELPRSTEYARRSATTSERAKDTAKLDLEVAAAHVQSERRYGSPRVHQQLRRQGRRVSRKRVASRMQALGLQARRRKRFKRTTRADPAHAPAPNLLERRFHWDVPNRAWVGDITYIRTTQGWCYLAILVDLCTRAIVGWAVSEHCDADLALHALEAACARYQPPPGLLHHTDRGATYSATSYRRRLRELGTQQSMSRKGDCWDNAVSESTIGSIKAELFGERVHGSIDEVRSERRAFEHTQPRQRSSPRSRIAATVRVRWTA